MPAACMPGVSI